MTAFLLLVGLVALVWFLGWGRGRVLGPKGRFVDGDHEKVLAAIDQHLVRQKRSVTGLGFAPFGIIIRTGPRGDDAVVTIRSHQIEVKSNRLEGDVRTELERSGLTITACETVWPSNRTWAAVAVSDVPTAEELLETALQAHRALGSAPTTGEWRWMAEYPSGGAEFAGG